VVMVMVIVVIGLIVVVVVLEVVVLNPIEMHAPSREQAQDGQGMRTPCQFII
jgi:hypothetical protein